LKSTYIYSITPGATNGLDQADGVQQLDPRGHATWRDFLVTMYDALPDVAKTKSTTVPGSFGNDYIAGGPADDMLFGQAGNDVIQGDGSIDYVAHVQIVNTDGTTSINPAAPPGLGRAGVQAAANYAGNPFRNANNE